MNIKKIEEELVEKLEELFPKGERCGCGKRLPCRSRALVFNAYAVMAIRELVKQVVESVPVEEKGLFDSKFWEDEPMEEGKPIDYNKMVDPAAQAVREAMKSVGYHIKTKEIKQWKQEILKELEGK